MKYTIRIPKFSNRDPKPEIEEPIDDKPVCEGIRQTCEEDGREVAYLWVSSSILRDI